MAMTKKDFMKLQNGSDIRGIACEGIEGEHTNLTPRAAYLIGQAFAIWLMEKKGIDLTTCIVLTNGDGYILNKLKMSGMVSRDDYIISIVKR